MSGVATMDGVGVSAAAVAVCRAAGEMGVDEASRLAVLHTAAEAARAESWVDDAIATAEAAALAAGVDVAGTREACFEAVAGSRALLCSVPLRLPATVAAEASNAVVAAAYGYAAVGLVDEVVSEGLVGPWRRVMGDPA